jgi:FixJ family two-component response regulator
VKPITEKGGEDSKLGARNTVYVVDDEPSVRKALSRLLRSAGFKCEVFASADEFLAHERESPAESGCLVLDVQMPGLNGMDLQEVLSAGEGRLPIIFITGHGDIPLSVRAMKKGAVDFLTKPFDDKDLLAAIAVALRKGEEARARVAEITQFRDREQTLTTRERDVMARVVAGLLNKQIAAELGIEEGTVKIHRGRVMQKMGVQSVAELVKMTSGITDQ